MRIAMTLLALSLAVGVTACKKKKTEPQPGPGTGSAPAGSGSEMAPPVPDAAEAMGSGSAGGAADMAKKAGNCPSTVLGSTTTAELKGQDIILTITSDDKDAIGAIQRRTDELLAEKKDGATGAAHDQKGTHGGGMGICPVFFGEGGTAKSAKTDKGVTITITTGKDKPEDLKANIDGRITKAADWVKANIKPGDAGNTGGVGGGAGEHGSTHQGSGDAKGKERKDGKDGTGGGMGTGGGGQKGTGGGGDKKDDKKGK